MSALRTTDEFGVDAVEVRADVQSAFNDELQRKLARTVWNTGGCRSWYLDESGRNTTLWPSSTFNFRARTHDFDHADYVLSKASVRPRRHGADAADTVVSARA